MSLTIESLFAIFSREKSKSSNVAKGILMYALVDIAGKQYKAQKGKLLKVDRLPGGKGQDLNLESVLLVSDGSKVEVGSPYVKGATVKITVEDHVRSRSIKVFKFKRRKGYRKTQGHRQGYTLIKVHDILGMSGMKEDTVPKKEPVKTGQTTTAKSGKKPAAKAPAKNTGSKTTAAAKNADSKKTPAPKPSARKTTAQSGTKATAAVKKPAAESAPKTEAKTKRSPASTAGKSKATKTSANKAAPKAKTTPKTPKAKSVAKPASEEPSESIKKDFDKK